MSITRSVAGLAVMLAAQAATAAPLGDSATPPGITLEPLGIAQGYELGKQTATFLARDQIAYADPAGLTLYTSEADPVGKSACVDACAKEWKAVAVPAGAKAFGKWSIIKRADGAPQWALSGKALYTSVKDIDPGSIYGNSPARFGPKRKNAAGQFIGGASPDTTIDTPLPAGWKPALAYPVRDVTLPADIVIKEVPDALAVVLVDHSGLTLYAADAGAVQRPGSPWRPAEAPQLSDPVGDFNFIVRADGIKQWTWKGKGLFTYSGDLAPGDANGIGLDKGWDVAAVTRYFLPTNVTVQTTLARGKVLATGKGLTLYRREAHIDQTGGGHNFRRGQPSRPAVGREIGLAHVRCDDTCREHWHPYGAPASAQAQGQWSVATHADGFRQWVYQGYPLWTFDGDTKPGDMTGHDDSLYAFGGMANAKGGVTPEALVDIGTPQDGGAGLYWHIAVP